MLGSCTTPYVFDADIVNSQSYKDEILEDCVRFFLDAMGPDYIFMDDNACGWIGSVTTSMVTSTRLLSLHKQNDDFSSEDTTLCHSIVRVALNSVISNGVVSALGSIAASLTNTMNSGVMYTSATPASQKGQDSREPKV
ncbi:hypothetical protein TNCV_1532111 [Trichonephila clavipes]|nr:hypothetical protein TNCV_1532111 [Trichonephila clavipes]